MTRAVFIFSLLTILFLAKSCREDEIVLPAEAEVIAGFTEDPQASPQGLYLLNEGTMGSNRASLDYLDLRTGQYLRDVYAARNPTVIKELGDVGNDLKVYGARLYAVLNYSNKIEVMQTANTHRIGQINLAAPRYICFNAGKAYISTYTNKVVEVDTATLSITREVQVGMSPEQLAVRGNYLYVANSGGLQAPDYDSTVSVIHLPTFRQVARVPVAKNLYGLAIKDNGIVVSTYEGAVYFCEVLSAPPYIKPQPTDYHATRFTIQNNELYGIPSPMTQGMSNPYNIAVNPSNGNVFIAEAGNYVSSGKLHCFSHSGSPLWTVRAGIIPSSIVFVNH